MSDQSVPAAITRFIRLPFEDCPAPPILWHYTTRAALLSILERPVLWATDVRFTNDAQELTHAAEVFKELAGEQLGLSIDDTRKGLVDLMRMHVEPVLPLIAGFAFCLSSEADDLSQWRAYGSRHGSYALGFDSAVLRRTLGRVAGVLSPCYYEREAQRSRMLTCVDEALAYLATFELSGPIPPTIETLAVLALQRVLAAGLLMKHPTFTAEREWRLLVLDGPQLPVRFRSGSSFITPYLELQPPPDEPAFGLREIMIGPSAHADLEERALKRLLLAPPFEQVSVSRTSTPYRSW